MPGKFACRYHFIVQANPGVNEAAVDFAKMRRRWLCLVWGPFVAVYLASLAVVMGLLR